jgi:hypothetical protein
MNAKVPAIVVASVIFFALGIGAGVLGQTFYAEQSLAAAAASSPAPAPDAKAGPPKGGPGGGGPGGGGGEKGKKGKGGGGGGFAPSAKFQLTSLVSKLDVLTAKPLYLDLPAETKAKVNEQLQGLDGAELSDDAAKAKLEGLLSALKDHKETLEASGFRWPGEAGGGGGGRFGGAGPTPPNPFTEEKAAKQLSTVKQRLQAPTKTD